MTHQPPEKRPDWLTQHIESEKELAPPGKERRFCRLSTQDSIAALDYILSLEARCAELERLLTKQSRGLSFVDTEIREEQGRSLRAIKVKDAEIARLKEQARIDKAEISHHIERRDLAEAEIQEALKYGICNGHSAHKRGMSLDDAVKFITESYRK